METVKLQSGEELAVCWVVGDGPGFEDARAVRRAVFVEEQGFSLIGEFDDKDAASTHLILYKDNVPVCTGRIFREGPGVMHVGRMAVAREMRGCGAGLAALALMADRAREAGESALVLGAQADKTGFYKRAGYAPYGDLFDDEGVPHQMMRLEL